MTLTKILPRLLVKPGYWGLHSAFILLLGTCLHCQAGHPTSTAELHGQLLCYIFSILTLQASSPKASSSQGPSANSVKLAADGLGNAGWDGEVGTCQIKVSSSIQPLTVGPGKSSEICPSGGGKASSFGPEVIMAVKAFHHLKSQSVFSSSQPI